MTDPKLVITEADWDDMKPELQAKTTYRTVISMREDVITLIKKVEELNNRPIVCPHEKRIDTLEKWFKVKTVATIIGGFFGGFGGSHIPK